MRTISRWTGGAPVRNCAGRDKIVLPILGDLYGAVLENRQFSLRLDENGFFVTYYDHRLPLDPKTYPMVLEHCPVAGPEVDALLEAIEGLPAGDPAKASERHSKIDEIKRELWRIYNNDPAFKAALDECLIGIDGTEGDPKSLDLLDRILDRQAYRVGYWRIASEELNYRRFFDITDLVGVRVEQPDVFDSRHMEILGLVKTGRVTGLRVDHIDGLRDPAAYLRRLRTTTAGGSALYVIVEKILGSDEELPEDWEQFGTTGYDFLNYLNGLFVRPDGVKVLSDAYRRFTGFEEDFARVRYTRKKQVMNDLFAGEVRALGFHLGQLAAQDRYARDLPYDIPAAGAGRGDGVLRHLPHLCTRVPGFASGPALSWSRHWMRPSTHRASAARRRSRFSGACCCSIFRTTS